MVHKTPGGYGKPGRPSKARKTAARAAHKTSSDKGSAHKKPKKR